jgi:hypothetical protein
LSDDTESSAKRAEPADRAERPEPADRAERPERARDGAGAGAGAGADEREVVVVDGSNVAHAEEGAGAKLENIRAVCAKLEEEGFRPVVLVDARLRHSIDDSDGYEAMVDDGQIRQAPAGTDADYFILSFARELDARVVSNDRFRDRASAFPEVRDRVIRFMILDGEVVFERRSHRRSD